MAKVILRSTGLGEEAFEEFHDLEFGLSLTQLAAASEEDSGDDDLSGKPRSATPLPTANSNLAQRSNIVIGCGDRSKEIHWKAVPGDLADTWKRNYFDRRRAQATDRQMEERNFYIKCAICERFITEIKRKGPVSQCSASCGLTSVENNTDNIAQV